MQMLYKAVVTLLYLLLEFLGDWHHVYYLLCTLQYTTALLQVPFLHTRRWYIIRNNMTNMITITNLY